MYEFYRPYERVFVDREEYLDWMADALKRCKGQSVLLHIKGIGGIGKSALFNHWDNSMEPSILIDCSRYIDFYERLDAIARGAVRQGVKLRRFDMIWHIRLRFIKGVEPAKEGGRGWAFEALATLPFIGTLGNIGKAISEAGHEFMPVLKGRFGDVGRWLRSRLGKQYGKRLLEILWREPAHAEFLFIDALLEDLNQRDKSLHPLLIMLDQFEDVDHENLRWTHKTQRICEKELWCLFLSLLQGAVGVIGSRETLSDRTIDELKIETKELTELDLESSIELVTERGVGSEALQLRIVDISRGHPFVSHAMCDLAEFGGLQHDDLAGIQADTLDEIRLKTWKKLFGRATGMLDFIDRAGLVPFFDRSVMSIIAPKMKSFHWTRMKSLSFVKDRGDGNYSLHDLARELLLGELGERLSGLSSEVSGFLEKASEEQSDYSLLGMSLFARALASEKEALTRVREIVCGLVEMNRNVDALSVIGSVRFPSEEGKAVRLWLKGKVLSELNRVAEAEQALQESLETFKELAQEDPDRYLSDIATTLLDYAYLLRRTSRSSGAEEAYREALWIRRELAKKSTQLFLGDLATTLQHFAWFLNLTRRPQEAERTYREALEIQRELSEEAPEVHLIRAAQTLNELGVLLQRTGRPTEAETAIMEAMKMIQAIHSNSSSSISREYARALHNLSHLKAQTGFPLEAESLLLEAIRLLRILAADSPEVYLSELANSLKNLAVLFRQTGRSFMAEDAIRECIRILEAATKDAPELCMPYLAGAYRNLAILLTKTNSLLEAEVAFQEGVRLYSELAEQAPHVFVRSVAYTLNGFAALLRKTNRLSEAKDAVMQALEMFSEDVEIAPTVYSKYLAIFLNHLAIIDVQMGRLSEAEDAYRKALEMKRQLVSKAPELHMPSLSITINNLGVLLRREKRLTEAEEAHREALEARRQLAVKSPELYHHRLATSLNNLGIVYAEESRFSEALESLAEALSIRRELADRTPQLFDMTVASTLINLGILYRRTGKYADAELAYREALEIRERLAMKAPAMFNPDVITALGNLLILLQEVDETSDSIQEIRAQVKELGGKKPPKDEVWSEEMETEDVSF